MKSVADPQLPSNRPLVQVGRAGLSMLGPAEVTPEVVGHKALGLLALPEPWVPPFFVVHADAVDQSADATALHAQCSAAIDRTELGREVIVRSSGVAETMDQRGSLVSERCSAEQVSSVLRRLAAEVGGGGSTSVHWLVQQWIRPTRKGHLSNERRLVYEPRDWYVEVEPEGEKPGSLTAMGIRRWRDGSAGAPVELRCSSEHQISLQLKAVGKFAVARRVRMHFEWVWSGSRLWIVQADVAESTGGVEPESLRPVTIPKVRVATLSMFRQATDKDLDQYKKLKNANIYTRLGYKMPPFYILDDPHAVEAVLRGECPEALRRDLEELTTRPLVIRTDGRTIPEDKREMLPRSDELRSTSDAVNFLTGKFRDRVSGAGLAGANLCLIAHHFIPSLASAWARAEPNRRTVRIEALWGIPEGLYWYSHDTFEVDLETHKTAERLRYKGTFVAPDPEGRWIPMSTAPPHDWRRSVKRDTWIREIATTTRAVADHEGIPVSLMWFVDTDKRATSHAVLPWYHSRSELGGPLKAAPRRKLTAARDYRIETRSDWSRLRAMLIEGKHIERVVVAPSDPDLIRDQQFAEELATLAASNQIVVELAGGLLSHAYYVLCRHRAQVECVDLFGNELEVREFYKLVRDEVPASIQQRGEGVAVLELRGDALVTALKQKLVEEAYEAVDSRSGDEMLGELADMQEVIQALCDVLAIPLSQLENERESKHTKRGGFKRGLMLTKTSTPHTLTPEESMAPAMSLQDDSDLPRPLAILRPEGIPSASPYRRPDLRTVGERPEKLFTFETDLSRSTERTVKHTTRFIMPLEETASREFTLTLEFARHRGTLRGTLRLRPEPLQLPIQLGEQRENGPNVTEE